MHERPILMTGIMVMAILADRKTQTRRIAQLPKWSTQDWKDVDIFDSSVDVVCANTGCMAKMTCYLGEPGDSLWVKETYCAEPEGFVYRADNLDRKVDKWKPSIFMARQASRLNLIIQTTQLQRLNEITREDAIAEGIFQMDGGYWTGGLHKIKGTYKCLPDPISAYRDLWNSINLPPTPHYARNQEGKRVIIEYVSYPWSQPDFDAAYPAIREIGFYRGKPISVFPNPIGLEN